MNLNVHIIIQFTRKILRHTINVFDPAATQFDLHVIIPAGMMQEYQVYHRSSPHVCIKWSNYFTCNHPTPLVWRCTCMPLVWGHQQYRGPHTRGKFIHRSIYFFDNVSRRRSNTFYYAPNPVLSSWITAFKRLCTTDVVNHVLQLLEASTS